jgi:hypothetical protein
VEREGEKLPSWSKSRPVNQPHLNRSRRPPRPPHRTQRQRRKGEGKGSIDRWRARWPAWERRCPVRARSPPQRRGGGSRHGEGGGTPPRPPPPAPLRYTVSDPIDFMAPAAVELAPNVNTGLKFSLEMPGSLGREGVPCSGAEGWGKFLPKLEDQDAI